MKHTNTSSGFKALMAAVENETLRDYVADSALTNATDTMMERGYRPNTNYLACWGDKQEEFWEMAIATAEMILDDPKAYYPELYRAA